MFYPHAVILPGGATITQLLDCTPAFNFTDIAERSPSDVGPTFTGSSQSIPDLQFRTPQIKTVLDNFTDFNICGNFASGNVDVEYRAARNLGTREPDADEDHLRVRLEENCYGSWQSLRCDAGGTAEIACRLVPVYDGVNQPLVPTSGVALTATAGVQQLYTLGPVKINGTTLELVQGFDWQNNLEYDEHVSDSGFLTWSSVLGMAPVITVRSRKTSYLASFGTTGTLLSSFAVYLRKRKRGAMNEAAAEAAHILFSNGAGTVKARQASGSEVEISIHLEKSGSSFFSVDTSSTIS